MGGSVSGKHGDSFLFLRSTSSDLLRRFNPGQCTVFKIVKNKTLNESKTDHIFFEADLLYCITTFKQV